MSRMDPPLHADPASPPAPGAGGPLSTHAARDEARPPREPAPRGAPGAVAGLGGAAGGVASAAGGLAWRATKVALGLALGLVSAGVAAVAAFSALA